MSYLDGFVIPVPTDKKEVCRKMCTKAAVVFKEHGATRIVECWGDDVPNGKRMIRGGFEVLMES